MPQNNTRKSGAITSLSRFPAAATSSALPGFGCFARGDEVLSGADDVAARFLVGLELDEVLLFRFLEEVGKRAEAIIGLVETGVAALEGLLDHRAPDLFVGAALGDERLEGGKHQVE